MFAKKINIKQMDRIMLNESDLNTIDNKLKLYIDNNPVLKAKAQEMPLKVSAKGIYELKLDKETVEKQPFFSAMNNKNTDVNELLKQMFYYEFEVDHTKIGELDKDGNLLFMVKLDNNTEHIGTQVFSSKYSRPEVKGYITNVAKSILGQVANFMIYSQLMAFLNEENSIIKKQAHIKGYQPKKLTKKEREREARKRVSVSKPKVDYDYNEAQREGDKRLYERQAESWEVTGHWRNYKKSGKRVFVKGYKKGNGEAKQKGKDFTI